MTSLRPGLARLSQKSWRGALPADRAYDLWAQTYDRDDNPVKHLERRLLEKSLRGLRLKSPALLDFGCGTGRHWQLFLRSRPRRLLGCDVSRGMLKVLKAKHPRAEIFLLKGKGPQRPVHFSFLAEASLDLVVCSLTLGYLGEIGSFLNECRRVLKPGGHLLVSDLHPDRVAEGARRDFPGPGGRREIRHFHHGLKELKLLGDKQDFRVRRLRLARVDATVKHFYRQAPELYRRSRLLPLVYMLELRRKKTKDSYA